MSLQSKTFSASVITALLISFANAKAQTDTLKFHNSNVLVLPVIARSIETNWAFGAAASFTFHPGPKDKLSRTSNVQALALYSLRKQFVIAINGSIYFPGERFIINQQLSYSYYPDKFWGLGKYAPDSSEEDYSYKQYYIYLHPQIRIGNKIYLGLLYEFQKLFDVNYEAGGLFDKENIPGRNGYHVSGLGQASHTIHAIMLFLQTEVRCFNSHSIVLQIISGRITTTQIMLSTCENLSEHIKTKCWRYKHWAF